MRKGAWVFQVALKQGAHRKEAEASVAKVLVIKVNPFKCEHPASALTWATFGAISEEKGRPSARMDLAIREALNRGDNKKEEEATAVVALTMEGDRLM